MKPEARIYWQDPAQRDTRALPPLSKDEHADAVVVGGGVAGLACAQALVEQGRDVVLLERDTCGSGASGRSSGFVTPDSEMELSSLIRTRGAERARRLWDFVVGGVDGIRRNIERHAIECDFQVQDSLFLANSSRAMALVRREHDARIRLGYHSTLYDAESICSVLGSEECCGGVRYPGTFGIDAFRYCQGMRDILQQSGVRIYEQSCVTDIAEGRAVASGFTVRANAVMLCVDRLLPELGLLESEVSQIQTFLAVSAPLTQAQLSLLFPESKMMVWDSDLIYQYFRIVDGNRLLVGASSPLYTYAGRKRGIVPQVLRKMSAFVSEKFPSLSLEFEYFWPGLIGVSKDLLPLAGRDARRPTISYVTSATGLAWAAALGRYLAEKVQSGRSDFDAEFDPHRSFAVGAGLQRLIGKRGAFALSHGIVKMRR